MVSKVTKQWSVTFQSASNSLQSETFHICDLNALLCAGWWVYILSEIPLYIWSCDQWDREIKVSVLAVGLPVPLLWAGLCFIFWTFRLIWCWGSWVVPTIRPVISVAPSITTNTLPRTILHTKWPNNWVHKHNWNKALGSSSEVWINSSMKNNVMNSYPIIRN